MKFKCFLKRKFKRYFFKIISFLTIFVIAFCCFLLPASASETFTIQYLDEFFSGVAGDFNIAYPGDTNYLKSPFFYSKYVGPGPYSFAGDLKSNYSFDTTSFYTISIPLSCDVNKIDVDAIYLTFFDKDWVAYDFKIVGQPFGDTASTYGLNTWFFELSLPGRTLVNLRAYGLYVDGVNWLDTESYLKVGLAVNRNITITKISQAQYDSIYGNKDYSINTGDTIARVDAVEDELFANADLNSIVSNVFQNGTWFVNVSNSILASGMIFGELYNFGGTQYTWVSSLARFALSIGLWALILAIGPGMISALNKRKK